MKVANELWLPDVAALVSGPDGIVVRASDQAAELAGETLPEELVGRRLTELLVPDGAAWRLRSRGPSVSLVRTAVWPHHDDGRLLVTVLLDVSDLATALGRLSSDKQVWLTEAERAAEQGDPSLHDVQRMARIGTWQWDPRTDVLRLSATLRELTGQAADMRMSFEDYLDAVHPDDRAWVRDTWYPFVSHQHPVEVEHRYLRPDGAVRVFRLHGSATRDPDGNVILIGTTQDITEQRASDPSLRYRATHDVVTGLPNRAAVQELLSALPGRSDADSLAVLACRIDNFKRVITSLGHDAGDELLVLLARRLIDGLGEECTVARIAGEDEFLIICSDLAAAGGLEALTGRVSGLVRTPVPVRDHLLQVSASIGAAIHDEPSDDLEGLLRFATAAMSQATQHGIDQVRRAEPALMASADQQVRVEGQLRDAVRRDGLRLHYQPVVATDGSIIGAEALVRWPHPERGLLSPGTFLPVAERGGLLRELDEWVLRTALRDAARWPCSHGAVHIAVNLTGLVPGDPAFGDVIAEAVAESGIDWHRIVLELVETELADPRTHTRRGMLRLARRGARFAIDDFGTGHSSLARLKHLPAELIKVDRQFVAGIEHDAADRAMTHAIVDMAHALGRRCIAEGVETAGQFHVLRDLGADAYQGWLFAHALPEPEFATLLRHTPLYVPPPSA
ncbi:bifunctional diguanylate cyclase/phosphodiesterase [Saccharopolyspora gloriosae]|uniref:putative bifunctional diguanylate cyclase/phosphodiesterase n=1 Tax=Saccharopolyspora gloriosae TaxID=455344 RepID=UPI001FB7283A|nr:EAL domain-containing protein [Saccharopolyspora gloriosae]